MLRNIIVVNDFAQINGGAAKVAINSAIKLSENGLNVILFSAVLPIDPLLKNSKVKIICTNQYDILHNPNRLSAIVQGIWNKKASKEFEDLLNMYSPEDTVIHLHGWIKALSPSILSVLADHNFKIVITLHDYFLLCPNGGLFNYKTKQICDKRPMSLSCCLCNCDVRNYKQKIWRMIRSVVQNKVIQKNKNIYLIYISELNRTVSYTFLNKLANEWYFLRNPIDITLSTQVPIKENDTYLFIGRLSAEKGIELFCKAISELGLKGEVLGDGYLKRELEVKYPNIVFHGWVSGKEKEKLISKGKALVFPSLWYEGAPLTIIEAKAYGLPCIVPDLCAASEEIIDGNTGYIFKTGSLSSLKDTIKKFEEDDVLAIQNNIRNDFNVTDYTLETHCKSLLSIYRQVLA